MTATGIVFRQLLTATAIGILLGLYYSFLRPLRHRHIHFADFLFCLGAGYGWLVLNFAVCRADIRLGYNLLLAVGCLLGKDTLGLCYSRYSSGFGILQAAFSLL